MKVKTKLKNQSGMILILAIIVITVAIGGAALFSNLIIREILQSRLIDQSIQSHYFAESGAERALRQIRHREAVRDCRIIEEFPDITCSPAVNCACLDTGFCTRDINVPCVNIDDSGLSTRGDWSVNATNAMDFSILLKKGESFQIDLFTPFESFQSGINRIELSTNNIGPIMQGEFVNLTKILNVTNPLASNCLTQPPVLRGEVEFVATIISLSGLDNRNILVECSYTFRLQYPINVYTIDSLITLTVFNQISGTQLPIPGRLLVESESIFGKSFQQVKVRAPIRPPLSGLYDFVLFSEEKIEKN